MNILRFIFYNFLFVMSWITFCINLYKFIFEMINHIKLDIEKKFYIDIGNCILTGIAISYIFWYVLTNPTSSIKLW